MDCAQDIEFHDDRGRALEKAKESILLMKKKMFRSHDLILQYNNKLKECERLKGDLCIAQEEAAKLKRDNNTNLSKVVKLEMQSSDFKKCRQELEQKIMEKEIQIASDKSHLQQLQCKLEAIEDKHAEKVLEAELNKSSMEEKVKELEKEMKALKKSHLTEINKLERSLKSPKKKEKKIIEVAKETREVGVNTDEEVEQPEPVKTATVDKSVSTDEFYHIKDNPYPIFCDRCESLMEPKVEKICKIMAHPPLVSNMLSPIRPCEKQRPYHDDSNNFDPNCHNVNLNDANRVELNPHEFNRVTSIPRNFISPLPTQKIASNVVQEIQVTPLDATVTELESLRQKVATLERKIKKQKSQKPSDSQPPSGKCCSHSHSINCCGHLSTHVNQVPNVFPNTQADLMTEFFNRMMNYASEREIQQKNTKFDSSRKEPSLRDKRAKYKLRKLKRTKSLKKKRSSNWNVESDDCNGEKDSDKCFDTSDPTKPHLLRIKPTRDVNSPSEKVSPLNDSWEASFAEASPCENFEKLPVNVSHVEIDYTPQSTIKVPNKSKLSNGSSKRGRASYQDDFQSEMEIEIVKNKSAAEENVSKNCTRSTRSRSKSLRQEEEYESKSLPVRKSNLEQENIANSSWQSAINELSSISSDDDLRDRELSIFSENLGNNDSVSYSKDDVADSTRMNSTSIVVASDADQSDVPPQIYSGSEPLECTNLQDRVELRKRKRSNSPKATKRTGRSNLLGKLRALKKNSVLTVAQTSNTSAIHATRSLSRRKLTELSESEDVEGETKEGKKASSFAGDEPSVCVPAKKQRIAHVPKKATSPDPDGQETPANTKISKLQELSDEVSENPDKESADDSTIAKIKRSSPRRLAIEKLAEIKLRSNQETSKIVEIDRVGLPAIVPGIRRRGRPPGKRNANIQLPVNSRKNEMPEDSTEKSQENQNNIVKAAETLMSLKTQDTKSNKVAENTDDSLENIGVKVTSAKTLESPEKEKTSKSVSTELVQAAQVLFVQSETAEESLISSISAETSPTEKTEVARALPAEKSSALLDASPASPAASIATLDDVLMVQSEFSISPNQSAVSSSSIAIENNRLDSNSPVERHSTLTKKIDVPSVYTEYSIDHEDLTASVETRNGKDENKGTMDESKISPASPDSSPSSPDKNTDMSSKSTKPEERLSIYDNVALSIPLEETANSSPLNYYKATTKNVTLSNPLSLRDKPNDIPIEKPIERSLICYDTDLHDNLEDDRELFDSRNIANPQFFVETSTVAKNKSAGNCSGTVKPINVVKELRSRQVLCSPSTSVNHQNLQKFQSPLNDEINTTNSSDASSSQSDCYFRVRNLGTMLNHHLSEQKKKPVVKNAKLRRAGAIKLQETAEKNVKEELENFVESEEWTSELHQSVMTKLVGFRSERTVAKSIVDFLVERASLDEPLDRTYTPPAPVMTRSQQRIVTLIKCLERENTMPHIFDYVQAGIEYTVFRLGVVSHPIDVIEYLVRIFTVISRIRKDRERVRIMCCDAFYCLGRKAIPVLHIILTVWPEVLPKHGTVEGELPNCLAHMIKLENVGKDPYPRIIALKRMLTLYYAYPENQAPSAIVMKVLMKAFREKYSNDLEAAILLVSKREGTTWALENVINQGLINIIQEDHHQWHFEVLSLLGFILRSFPILDTDKTVQKIVNMLCEMLDSGKGSHDKQEGIVSALLSISRHKPQFIRISDSLLKWTPSRELRASTLERLDLFFKSRTACWWNMRLLHKIKNSDEASGKSN